jgi:acyl-ACP thioesterase
VSEPWETFEAPYRVRFDESGTDGRIRTSVLLRYAQDIAWQHSDARGYDRAWYGERGLTWVVRAVEIAVAGVIPMGAALRVTTRVLGHRRVWSRRLGEVHVGKAPAATAPAATVATDWLLLDAAGRPTRIPPEFEAAFDLLPASNGLLRVSPEAPRHDAVKARVTARPQELDPLGHVNNAVYLDWMEEHILAAEAAAGLAATSAAMARLPRRYRIEYAGSAEAEVDLEGATWPTADGWAWRLADRTGVELVRGRLGRD